MRKYFVLILFFILAGLALAGFASALRIPITIEVPDADLQLGDVWNPTIPDASDISMTAGAILYGSGGYATELAIGSTGQVLTVVAAKPAWANISLGVNTLGEIGDVSTTTLAVADILMWDGTNWINQATTSIVMAGEFEALFDSNYNATTTLNGLTIADYLQTANFDTEWNANHNATTTYPGFATQFAAAYNATTTQTNFAPNWNALYNATTTLNGLTISDYFQTANFETWMVVLIVLTPPRLKTSMC